MATIIDRRLNPPGKSVINRQKFLKRAKEQIKETVKKSIGSKDIKEIGNGEKVRVRNNKDISEPTFNHDPSTGNSKRVLPGNKEYSEDDHIQKPQGGSGGQGSGEGSSESEDGLEEFQFTLTREEFLQYLFEDLELPDFIKKSIDGVNSTKTAREGYTTSGSPANLNVGQTFKKSIGRRIALNRPSDEEIQEAEYEWQKSIESSMTTAETHELYEYWQSLIRRQKIVPFIEENDLKYNFWTKHPEPISKAVIFCLMDVSGSMGEYEKDIAKRFFLLLYLFVEKRYDKIDIRFIRHTTEAQEVNEHSFFYDQIMGGTIISSGLKMISNIIDEEYNPEQWNIYIAQCSDGDNSYSDNQILESVITSKLLPLIQYFAYIQVGERDLAAPYMMQFSCWYTYSKLSEEHKKIVAKQIKSPSQVWTAFTDLFSKDQV